MNEKEIEVISNSDSLEEVSGILQNFLKDVSIFVIGNVISVLIRDLCPF